MITTRSFLRSFRFHLSIAFFLIFSTAIRLNVGLNDDILKLTNEFRKSKRLTELVMRDDLNEIARKHSDDMAKGRCSFGHAGFNQREQEVQKNIDPFYAMAENVAFGATTAKEVVTMWENSSEHRKNMLGDYKYIGIGTAADKTGRIYYTEIFVK